MKPIPLFCRVSIIATLLCFFVSLSAHSASAIVIDGNLDDALWKKARPLESFKTVQFKTLRGVTPAGQKAQAETTGLVFTGLEYLYLGFRSEEPLMDKLEARKLPRDGSIWTNDCIEVFIAPFEDSEKYFQLTIDVANQVYDAFKMDGISNKDYDISVIAKSQKMQNGWTMEIAIPLSDIGLSLARDALINFGRERKTVNELTAWRGDFGKPETWQRLPLSLNTRYDVDIRDWNFGALQYGKNSMSVAFVPSTNAPVGILLQTCENGRWVNKARQIATSIPGKATHFALTYTLDPHRKPERIRLVLERGGQSLFRATRRVSLPDSPIVATLTLPYFYTYENTAYVRLQNFVSPRALKTSYIRLRVTSPHGKVVASSDIHNLRPLMTVGIDVSSWKYGDGTLTAELHSNEKILSSRTIVIPKRPGPLTVDITSS